MCQYDALVQNTRRKALLISNVSLLFSHVRVHIKNAIEHHSGLTAT